MDRHQPLSGALKQAHDRSGFAIWLTGPPASGKTTLAVELKCLLGRRGIHTLVLDSDDLRQALTPHPTYTETERDWFYAVITYLGAWLTGNHVNVLIAATGHKRAYRQQAREQIQRFAEVYVECALDVCQARDRKGIYALAASGQGDRVPGIGVPYEPPLSPEAAINTGRLLASAAASAVLAQLDDRLYLSLAPIHRRSS